MKKALLLVDIQKDYFEGGKCELSEPIPAVNNAGKVLDVFTTKGDLVVFIQHINTSPNATFFIPNTPGCDIHESIKPLDHQKVVIKHAPNSFYNTELKQYLEQNSITHLIICGMMSHMCIDTTVRAAKDYGFTVTVLEDACTTKDLSWNNSIISAKTVHQVIMASLNGMFGEVLTVEQYLKSEE